MHLSHFPPFNSKTLKKNFADLQKSLDESTRLSVATVTRKILGSGSQWSGSAHRGHSSNIRYRGRGIRTCGCTRDNK